jgi:hypothetical protein
MRRGVQISKLHRRCVSRYFYNRHVTVNENVTVVVAAVTASFMARVREPVTMRYCTSAA